MKTTETANYGIDWTNIDLNSPSESEQKILDPYSFDDLLMEINCNLPVITEDTITKQFNDRLAAMVTDAKEIFQNNLANITAHATKTRETA